MSTFLWNFCTGSYLKLNLVINAFFLYCKLFMYLKMSDIISLIKLGKSRCFSLLLCFWHINCLILMVIYPNNYSNFRTIMEVIMKNKWLLCILLMLFLPFGLFAQVAPPLENRRQKHRKPRKITMKLRQTAILIPTGMLERQSKE